jgi:hypothetical protein
MLDLVLAAYLPLLPSTARHKGLSMTMCMHVLVSSCNALIWFGLVSSMVGPLPLAPAIGLFAALSLPITLALCLLSVERP